MSETPRTDAEALKSRPPFTFVTRKFAEELERECDEARQAFAVATSNCVEAQQRVREMADQRDFAMSEMDRLKRERDEARAEVAMLREERNILARAKAAVTEGVEQQNLPAGVSRKGCHERPEPSPHFIDTPKTYESDTPETCEAVERWQQGKINIFDEMARLERERDEAREQLRLANIDFFNTQAEIEAMTAKALGWQKQAELDAKLLVECREKSERYRLEANAMMAQRDQAQRKVAEPQAGLDDIEEYGTEEINAAVDLRHRLAAALLERDEARKDLDEEMKFHHRTHGECVMAQCALMDARAALQRIADCDWVITLPDRMDAVRKIARDALEAAK